jgi:hypothetical protein
LSVEQSFLDGAGLPDWSAGFATVQLKVGDRLYSEADNLAATYR